MKRPAGLGWILSFCATFLTTTCSGENTRREADLMATVSLLTSPQLEGRPAAGRGGLLASELIASKLEALGWLPAGDSTREGRSFFQSIPAVEASLDPGACWIEASGGGRATVRLDGAQTATTRTRGSYTANVSDSPNPSGAEPAIAARAFAGPKNFQVLPDRGHSIEVSGELAFGGFGIEAPEHQHDDYASLDPRGKVLLVFSGEPGETDPTSPWNGVRATRHALVATKARLARAHGVVALLVAPSPAGKSASAADLTAGRESEMSRPWLGLAAQAVKEIPVIFLDPRAARLIAEGMDLASASLALEAGHTASRDQPGRLVRLRLVVKDRRQVALRNVIARLGSGKGTEGEIVVVGAHWDGLGASGGRMYPGADDNASGIAVLLQVARALKDQPPRGARDVVLGAWTGEESGRLGSSWFVEHPPVPTARIAAAINLDMLGRTNLDRPDYAQALQLIYSAGAPVLREIAREANEKTGFDLRFYPGLAFQPVSDHYTFSQAGIPILYPFSGYHTDYHQAGDVPEKLIPGRLVRSGTYVSTLARLLAEHASTIRLDPKIKEPPPADPFERPGY